uniref:Uncharacterized protein n=1 Tax=Physcomitrium patens TaxID=3218 RepID=A0A2K1L1W2_PHYPA|nr:hypothetical protein PHYPA_002811 [Physcomitrium patens]
MEASSFEAKSKLGHFGRNLRSTGSLPDVVASLIVLFGFGRFNCTVSAEWHALIGDMPCGCLRGAQRCHHSVSPGHCILQPPPP